MKIGIVTLGCDKNTVDNEYLAGILDRYGVEVEYADKQAGNEQFDAVLINTCGFVESARVESIQSILSWVERKREQAADGRRMRVFVAGCLSQRYRESLIAELPEVDGFMGVGEFERVLDLVRSPVDATSPVNLIGELPAVKVDHALPRKHLGPQTAHAFLKIGDGCNHHCTFCAIPGFKGRLQSVPREILLAEARMLLSRGVREINLVAQDTSDYGKDLYGGDYGIAELLKDLAAISGDFWLRLFYFYPGGLTPRFLEVFGSTPKIARYIDIPLQHLHPEILKQMKRPNREVNSIQAIARLREAVPGIAIRTTFIVGFPGETREHFEHLFSSARALRFERMGAFVFSPEEGTSASALEQVPKRTRQARFDRLMRQQADIAGELNQAQVGLRKRVLIEGRLDDGNYYGRSEHDAVDVDGLVLVSSRRKLIIGDFADVTIVRADTYDLHGRAVQQS